MAVDTGLSLIGAHGEAEDVCEDSTKVWKLLDFLDSERCRDGGYGGDKLNPKIREDS